MEDIQGEQALSIRQQSQLETHVLISSQSAVFIKSYAPIASVSFSQTTPYRYAVTSGTRIQIYSSKTNRVIKTISKFKETARSGVIRDDGKLVMGADDSGLVQVRQSRNFPAAESCNWDLAFEYLRLTFALCAMPGL